MANHAPHPMSNLKSQKAQIWIDPIRCVVKVKADFNANFNMMNRGLEGRAWHPADKLWEFNLQAIPALLKTLDQCGYQIQRPPLEIMEIFEGFDTEDLEMIYRAMIRTKAYQEKKKLIDSFFKNYINISDAHSKLGRMIRTDPNPDDSRLDDLI